MKQQIFFKVNGTTKFQVFFDDACKVPVADRYEYAVGELQSRLEGIFGPGIMTIAADKVTVTYADESGRSFGCPQKAELSLSKA